MSLFLSSNSFLLRNLCQNSKKQFLAVKSFHVSSANKLVSKEFDDAKASLAKLKEDPGNDVKLKLYALFKQVLNVFSSFKLIFHLTKI